MLYKDKVMACCCLYRLILVLCEISVCYSRQSRAVFAEVTETADEGVRMF
jgi:hypothetical protein